MDQRQFSNGLRVLYSIDQYELVEAGILTESQTAAWQLFRDNPPRWFMNIDDETADKLWELMVRRGVGRANAAA